MTVSTENGGARLTGLLRTAVWGAAALLMLAPVVASQLTEEMSWTAFDYLFWGGMLLAGCGLFEGVMRMSADWWYRGGAIVAIGTAFLLVMASGAVGIIGSEDHPANLLYLGVLGIGVLGAAGARLRAGGMALTLAAMAAATVLIGVLTLVNRWGAGEAGNWMAVTIGANAVFAGAWALAAGLFRRAARASGSGAPRPR